MVYGRRCALADVQLRKGGNRSSCWSPRGQRSRHIDRPWPAGQRYQQVVDQVGGFLRDLVADWDRRMVIGHSATRWALDCLLDGKALEELVDARSNGGEGGATCSPLPGPAKTTPEAPPRSMPPRVLTALVPTCPVDRTNSGVPSATRIC